jgi:putative ABC transport system permease protein
MRLLRRLAYWLRLGSNHADLQDELAFHREMIERDLIRRGAAPDQARMQARRAMGNATYMREEARAVWLWPSLEAMWQDATYTLRDLRRNPTFTLGVTLTLALGIGANAAMFSLVDRLLLRPPARMVDPSSVHRVYLYRRTLEGEETQTGPQYARYRDIVRWSTSFSQAAGVVRHTLAVGVGNETQLRSVGIVSAGFFEFFDAPPVIGRYFTASEDEPPTPAPVAVLSQRLWETQFGSRRDVLGSTLQIDAVAYTIIGVAPDELVGLWPYQPPAAFVPVATYAASRRRPEWATTYGTAFGLGMIVRRRPGVTVAAASADLTNAFRRSYQAQFDAEGRTGDLTRLRPRAIAASILTERGPQPSSVARVATWLSGVTLIVLLIACANVANLLLARTIRRRREIAIRIALGVSRRRLFGQLLTEGMVLALLGLVAGVVIAIWAGNVLRALLLPDTEPAALITDPRTLLFAGAVALGAGLLTGLAPVTQARRASVTGDLKSGSRGGSEPARLRSALLVVQSALSVVLLVGAALFVRSLGNVRNVRLGFDADSVLVVSLNMRDVRLDSATTVALRLRLLESARNVPGVSHASLQESVPFGGQSSWRIFVTGIDSVSRLGQFNVNMVSPDYFATMGTRIVRGRGIESADVDGARRVAVIGEAMGAALWPGQDPMGRCFRIEADTMPCTYVVGVAQDIHSQTIEAESRLFFYYLPAAQRLPQMGGLFVRAQGDPSRLVEPVRTHLQREMPGTSFVTVRRLGEIVDSRLRSWIVGAAVFTAFGSLALVLAAIGLYSVIAYNVTQRKRELGVRLALGAAPAGIVRLVVAESVRFALAGIVIGSVVSFAAGSWIAPLLFQQSPRDPAVFSLVTAVLLGVAVAASWVPAMRAANVDPKTALQAE